MYLIQLSLDMRFNIQIDNETTYSLTGQILEDAIRHGRSAMFKLMISCFFMEDVVAYMTCYRN
jgi:hypothetical protein